MAATLATFDDGDLTAEERATLYVIAVYACGRGKSARFDAAQPCVVARFGGCASVAWSTASPSSTAPSSSGCAPA